MPDRLNRLAREGRLARRLPWRLRMRLERMALAAAARGAPPRFVLPPLAGNPVATLHFGGDLSLHRLPAGEDPGRRFGALRPLLDEGDALFLNLESQLTARSDPAAAIGSSLRAEPAALAVLRTLPVTAVTVANNHALDFGMAALDESIGRVRSSGVAVAGAEGPGHEGAQVVTVRGMRIGLLAFTDDWRPPDDPRPGPAPSPHDPPAVRTRIAELRGRTDLVVVQLHWGWEWAMHPPLRLRDLARSYAEAGAALVVCHHAHVPMGIERRGGAVIAHGLGNFSFGRSATEEHPLQHASVLLRVTISRESVTGAEAIPIGTNPAGDVEPLSGPAAARVAGCLIRLSGALDEDAYLRAVEVSAEARHGAAFFLDLERRLNGGDAAGARARARHLDTPRQRLLIEALRDAVPPLSRIAPLLERARSDAGALADAAFARELAGQRESVRRCAAGLVAVGRTP